jgi:DNA ligase 1
MSFKPMLAFQKRPNLSKITFPVLMSPKLDGFRALAWGGSIVSRNLKLIPSDYVQSSFEALPKGLDGELIVGDPTFDPTQVFRRTSSAVTRENNDPIEDLRYYIFDNFATIGDFQVRYHVAKKFVEDHDWPGLHIVEHTLIYSIEEALEFEAQRVKEGYEGAMIRSLTGPYKHGRSTENEGYLLKLKAKDDSEARILGFYERMHNENEAEIDALGHTERSLKKEGMVPAGTLGGFYAEDVITLVQFKLGAGAMTDPERQEIWDHQKRYLKKVAKYKFQGITKEKPRFPIFVGWRDPIDA